MPRSASPLCKTTDRRAACGEIRKSGSEGGALKPIGASLRFPSPRASDIAQAMVRGVVGRGLGGLGTHALTLAELIGPGESN
jgi:hypothetical protein